MWSVTPEGLRLRGRWTPRTPSWSPGRLPRGRSAARRKLADCDARLAKHRAALEAGADPTIVAGWMAEVQGERLAAERALAGAQPSGDSLSPAELRAVVEGLGDVAAVLADAAPKERAKVYADLGVTLTYRPDEDLVAVQAVPVAACAYERVGGGI